MKKSVLFSFAALAVSVMMFVSCGTTKEAAFAKMYEAKPEVLLIMPPINNSNNVSAKDYFYTTMNVPLAEAGYYVLPPAAVYSTMQRESAYDAERFLEGDLKKFRQLFGADTAVFTVIKSWEKSVIGSSVNLEIEYIFRSTKTNETVFRRNVKFTCNTSTGLGTNSLLGSLVIAAANAVKTAVTDYTSVAVKCNRDSLSDLPAGKYSPKYGIDGKDSAMPEDVKLSSK